jgi:hypothetical protein
LNQIIVTVIASVLLIVSGNMGVVTEFTLAVYLGPNVYTFGRFSYAGDSHTVSSILDIISRHNAAMSDIINIDIVIDSVAITLWVVYQGSSADMFAKDLNLILQDSALPPEMSRSVEEFVCFHELIEAYAAAKGYSQYSDQPYSLKNCLINSTSLILLSQLFPDPSHNPIPSNCGFSLIHFGGQISRRPTNFTVFPWRDTQYMLYGSCGWTAGNNQQEQDSRKYLQEVYFRLQSACHGSYVNFIDANQINWVHEYYGSNFDRLRQIKQRFNPPGQGPLHFPQEIPVHL